MSLFSWGKPNVPPAVSLKEINGIESAALLELETETNKHIWLWKDGAEPSTLSVIASEDIALKPGKVVVFLETEVDPYPGGEPMLARGVSALFGYRGETDRMRDPHVSVTDPLLHVTVHLPDDGEERFF